jgi:very-short-patch-repair endonuclease
LSVYIIILCINYVIVTFSFIFGLSSPYPGNTNGYKRYTNGGLRMIFDYIVFIIYLAYGVYCCATFEPKPDANAVDWSQRLKCDSNAEKKLFDALARINVHVITQVPIGTRMRIDLFLTKWKLACEVDSPFHDNPIAQARDRHKDRLIREKGWEIIRVRVEDIDRDLSGVVSRILAATDWQAEKQRIQERRRTTKRFKLVNRKSLPVVKEKV